MRVERVRELLTKKSHIAVVGDVMIDEYLWGRVKRISPEAPVPIVEINQEQFRPGGSANVAFNLIHLGQQVTVFGVVGNDVNGEKLKTLLKENRIATDGLVVDPSRPTTIKTRIIGENQHIARVDKESTEWISESIADRILEKFQEIIPSCQAVILEDYNKGVLSRHMITNLIGMALEHGVPVMVDPKFHHFFLYRNVTLFKPNRKETEEALHLELNNEEQILEAGKQLLTRLNARSVLITLGSQGMAFFQQEQDPLLLPALTHDVADVSGAGDTVIATVTAFMANGATVREAVTLANIAAAEVVKQVGVVPITSEKLIQAVEEMQHYAATK